MAAAARPAYALSRPALEMSSAEKTEQPTPKKLRDARARGDVPKSRELVAASGLLGAAAALAFFGEALAGGLMALLGEAVASAAAPSRAALAPALTSSLVAGATLLAPLLLVTLGVSLSVAYAQVGPVFAPARLAPDWQRLDAAAGLRRLFSKPTVFELLKSLLVLGIVGYAVFDALGESLGGVARASAQTPRGLLDGAGALTLHVMRNTGLALLAVGFVDVFYQRYRHRQDLRMTKAEVKREHREAEGDPHAKQRRARMHQEIVEHAALEEVRRADVLVVNPTHYAVALSFDREGDQEAPEVRAKGIDHLAKRMIDAAREAGVPVLRDVPLAHALYELEVGEVIPEELYEAVAAVLRVAWAEREGPPR